MLDNPYEIKPFKAYAILPPYLHEGDRRAQRLDRTADGDDKVVRDGGVEL